MGRERVYPVRCEHGACDKATREGKPYCSKHLEAMPYAAEVIRREQANGEEIAQAKRGRWKEIDVNGVLAQDALRLILQSGQASVGKISRDVTRDKRAATSYIRALKKAGLVRTKKIRGVLTAYPPKPPKPPKES